MFRDIALDKSGKFLHAHERSSLEFIFLKASCWIYITHHMHISLLAGLFMGPKAAIIQCSFPGIILQYCIFPTALKGAGSHYNS